jgi:hypothetical protein
LLLLGEEEGLRLRDVKVGRLERIMSSYRCVKSASPISGVLALVAPAGEQRVYPCWHPLRAESEDGVAAAKEARSANEKWWCIVAVGWD